MCGKVIKNKKKKKQTFARHEHRLCWTNRITTDQSLWEGTNEKKKKKIDSQALEAMHLQLSAVGSKCSVSRVHMKTQIIACLFSLHSFFSIILSRSKRSLPTSEPAWLKNGWVYPPECGLGLGLKWWDLRGRAQKSAAACGTKNPRALYCTWLTMGYDESQITSVCVCLGLCAIIKQHQAFCWSCVWFSMSPCQAELHSIHERTDHSL